MSIPILITMGILLVVFVGWALPVVSINDWKEFITFYASDDTEVSE